MYTQNTMKKGFSGDLAYLSNFYETPVVYEGQLYRNAESAYQAIKCEHITDRQQFITTTGAEAKKLGRTVAIRKDWDNIKIFYMINSHVI